MALVITPEQKQSIQKRTVVYSPIYVNGMTPDHRIGAYVLFYIFRDTDTPLTYTQTSRCIVEYLEDLGNKHPHREHTFVKIGNYSSGAKSRHDSNKGDMIKNDGNRSPAAKHAQDTLIANADLYLHFIMIVLSPDPTEKNLEEALVGIVKTIGNKQGKVILPAGKWNPPIALTQKASISNKLAQRIQSKLK